MNTLKWDYGNFSMLDKECILYNTLYIDMAKIHKNGLVLIHKKRVIGFLSLERIVGIFKNIYRSRTGLLLIDSSLYKVALKSLENFVASERIIIVSQFDYIFNDLYPNSRSISFFGRKQTLINTIEVDSKLWLTEIKKKHRYYVKKALNVNNQRSEVNDIESLDASFVSMLYDIYVKNMGIRGAELLFKSKGDFLGFVKRNNKKIIVTLCFIDNEISYFSIVHTNNEVANYIMAVSTEIGMNNYASYMGVFALYDYLYHHNIRNLNFGGVDLVKNHGIYLFKKGFNGKLIDSPCYMIIGIGITTLIIKQILKLRILVKTK
jgi:hypothetical protein